MKTIRWAMVVAGCGILGKVIGDPLSGIGLFLVTYTIIAILEEINDGR